MLNTNIAKLILFFVKIIAVGINGNGQFNFVGFDTHFRTASNCNETRSGVVNLLTKSRTGEKEQHNQHDTWALHGKNLYCFHTFRFKIWPKSRTCIWTRFSDLVKSRFERVSQDRTLEQWAQHNSNQNPGNWSCASGLQSGSYWAKPKWGCTVQPRKMRLSAVSGCHFNRRQNFLWIEWTFAINSRI